MRVRRDGGMACRISERFRADICLGSIDPKHLTTSAQAIQALAPLAIRPRRRGRRSERLCNNPTAFGRTAQGKFGRRHAAMDARTGTLRGAAKHIIHPVHLTWFFSPSRRRACKTHCTANRTYRSGAARMPSATTATANWPAGKFRDSLRHWAARHPMFYRTPFKRSRNTILANSCGWNTLRRLNHEAAPRIHLPRPSVIRPRRSSACMRTAAQNVNRPKHGVPARFGRRSPGNRKVSRVAVTRARASLAHRDHL